MRRLLFGPAICLLIVVFTLYIRRDQLRHLARPEFLHLHGGDKPVASTSAAATSAASTSASTATVSSVLPPDATTAAKAHDVLPLETRTAYVDAIMNPDAKDLPRLECPKLNASRYRYLQANTKGIPSGTIQYFFALDLRQCVTLLPRLLGSVVEVIQFLGPKHCALSIIEGNSDDGTGEVLAALRPALEALGVAYHFNTTTINPKNGDRIAALAQLRNLALQPIFDSIAAAATSLYTNTTKVIFLNDVAACPEDLLELVHQHTHLGADLVCGMDWTYVGPDPTFYDVWIARGMTGESFFLIPPDGNWNSAWNLFWNDASSQARFTARQPFQVFSCWNGGVVFSAAPLLGPDGVRFRRARAGECEQGEPQLFCKDLWGRGFGRIAVVPVVNLEYSDEAGRKIKDAKGYVSKWVGADGWRDEGVEWRAEPPAEVKCMAVYAEQFFEPWNVTLPGT